MAKTMKSLVANRVAPTNKVRQRSNMSDERESEEEEDVNFLAGVFF